MTRESELKPCPFCGGGAAYTERDRGPFKHVVRCLDCAACVQTVGSKDDAFHYWNTRHPAPVSQAVACNCDVMCRDLGKEAGCRYLRPERRQLRKLVDAAYYHAAECVPLTDTADEIIDGVFGPPASPSAETATIDSVPSCGQENDYRRAGSKAGGAAQGSQEPGYVPIPQSALNWLFGEGPDGDGKHFGECREAKSAMETKYPRRFWWRSKFRRMCVLPASSLPSADLAALECWSIVEQLRAPEGAEVTLICDNPYPGPAPNCGIDVCDDWTDWQTRRFGGDTVLECLRAAVAERDRARP